MMLVSARTTIAAPFHSMEVAPSTLRLTSHADPSLHDSLDALKLVPRYPLLAQTRGILVTGSHRSGTTWVGRMLSSAPQIAYIHEPFKPGWSLPYTFTRSETWFPHVGTHNARQWESDVLKTLRFGYSWKHTYQDGIGLGQIWKATHRWVRWTSRRFRGHRPLVKDPIALFATPWLADRFGLDVVVMMRHPAAFCSSIKIKNWVFDWRHWTSQTELMNTLLAPFADDLARQERGTDLIDQGILQWRIFHHVIDTYRRARPDWLFVRHEDLSIDPVSGFRKMFEHCRLPWSAQSEATVRNCSEEGNLQDAAVAGKSTHFVQLDSAKNVKNWQKRLSPMEISRIRKGTEDIAIRFYQESDWT